MFVRQESNVVVVAAAAAVLVFVSVVVFAKAIVHIVQLQLLAVAVMLPQVLDQQEVQLK